jgi:hypothetical protein
MSPLVIVQRKLNRAKRISDAQFLMAKNEGRSADHLSKPSFSGLSHREFADAARDNWL